MGAVLIAFHQPERDRADWDISCVAGTAKVNTSNYLVQQSEHITQMVNSTTMSAKLQQPLSSQFDLSRCFTCLVAALAGTDCDPLSQLDFILDGWEWAGAVVREMDAGEGAGAEVVRAVCCGNHVSRES